MLLNRYARTLRHVNMNEERIHHDKSKQYGCTR
jgi:hypothetical protein